MAHGERQVAVEPRQLPELAFCAAELAASGPGEGRYSPRRRPVDGRLHDGLQDLATLKGLQVNDNFALVAVDALVPGAGGSLKTVSDTVHVVGNLALPACAARKIHDALLKPPNYFCYIPNEPDACNEDPTLCKPLEPP